MLKKYAETFQPVKLFTIEELFGGWAKAQKPHFADGGMFDQIYSRRSDDGACRRTRAASCLGFDCALGFTVSYLSLIVLIPLSALVFKTATLEPGSSSGQP